MQLDATGKALARYATMFAAAPETAAERDRLRDELELLREDHRRLTPLIGQLADLRDQRDALIGALERTLRYGVSFACDARGISAHDWMESGTVPAEFSEAAWIKSAQTAIRAARGEG